MHICHSVTAFHGKLRLHPTRLRLCREDRELQVESMKKARQIFQFVVNLILENTRNIPGQESYNGEQVRSVGRSAPKWSCLGGEGGNSKEERLDRLIRPSPTFKVGSSVLHRIHRPMKCRSPPRGHRQHVVFQAFGARDYQIKAVGYSLPW